MFFSNYLYICKKTISITMAKQHYKFIILVFLVILGQSMSFAQERIPMKLEKSGIYTIPCEVNGLKLSFVFDTGASVVHISLLEAAFMLKNGYINENDFIGTGNYIMADGSIAENALINLKSIKIGNIVIKDVTACVSSNINASLLLGQSAIQKLGKYAIDGNYLVLYSGDYPDIDDDNRLNNQYKLWSALLEDYEMGAFEDFKRDVADDYKRRKLYFAIIDDYDLPDYETFSSQLGFDNINESISLERKIALAKERLGNLYRIFKEDGYKLATRIEYQNKLKDSATATRFYNNMTEDGYELGTLNDFLNLISLAYFSSQRDDSSFESDAQERSFSHNVDYYLAQVSSQVNLREGPGTNYTIISKVPKGSYVLLSSDDNGQSFRKVLYVDKNISGYVSNKYLANIKKLEKDASGNLQAESRTYKSTADIKIKNNTTKNATINVGSKSYIFKPHETRTITNLKPGQYSIMASAPGVIPFVAVDNIEAGYEYSWEFYITTVRH